MKTILGLLLSTAAAGLAFAGSAGAADMIDLPPLYESAPEMIQPVEIGNGWYLRGDASYALKSQTATRHREFRPDFEAYGPAGPWSEAQFDYFDAGSADWNIKAGAGVSVGAGYQFTDYFRGDLTATTWKHELSTGDRPIASCFEMASSGGADTALLECNTGGSGELKAWELMANAYVDLGTIAGFTPYVGGGVGAVRLDYQGLRTSGTCHYDGAVCDPDYYHYSGSHESGKEWRFSYALMAGAAYDLARNLKLDIGYRYLNVGAGDSWGFDARSRQHGAEGFAATDEGFDRHTVQAGLRYSLW